MRILQINDLHVAREGEDAYGVDVRRNLVTMVHRLRALKADLLVINGDLAYRDGDVEIYEWIKEKLAELTIPVAFTSGNHDDPELMADVFGLDDKLQGTELYYHLSIRNQHCLFLDTTTRRLSLDQLEWLRENLETHSGQIFVFMHHPPLIAGVPYMDNNYALQDMDKVQELFQEFEGEVYIFCGHYHVDKMVRRKNMTVFITPACFFQINQYEEDFKVDHYRIGFREINWQECSLMTSVHYLQGTL